MTPIVHHFTNVTPHNVTLTITILDGDRILFDVSEPEADDGTSVVLSPADIISALALG